MSTLRAWITLAMLSAVIAAPAPVDAQAVRTGNTFRIGGTTSPVILPDVAYDPVHDRYLVVSGNGFIEGQLLDANGTKLTAFPIAGGVYSQTPRVAFGADVNGGAGGYLVTWHETVGPVAQVRGRLISTDGNALTGDIIIAPEATVAGTGSNWTMGAAVAYSTGSREFLVTWMGGYLTTQDIRFNRISATGVVLQAPAAITGGVDWERDPSVAYNSVQDEFYIAYAGYFDAGGFGYVNGQRIKAGTGAAIGSPTMFIQSVATLIPHVEYSPARGEYVVVWYNRTSGSAAFYGVSVRGSDGGVIGGVRLVSSRYFAYDALDFAYNPVAGDYLLVTHAAGLQDYEDAAIPLNADGSPHDNGFILTNTPDVRPVVAGDGNFNPRIAAGASRRYLAVTASKFAAVHGQFATSTASGGGGPPPPPPPPPVTPNPRMFLDVPGNGALVQPEFAVAGWAVDLGAPSGTGVAAVHVWALPTTGAPAIFLGAANIGVTRPDIAAHFGRSELASSGFGLSATLPPGTYDVIAFAFSTVSGTFNNQHGSRITVVAPPPNPKMFIDNPSWNQHVTNQFIVSGWAVDLGSWSGPGASVVHVWAYPHSGAPPIFVGAALVANYRPDVAQHFDHWRYHTAGYSLQGSLPSGAYNLVVFAFSTVTGTFNQATLVPIVVH